DLSALFPNGAARYVAQHNGQVFPSTTIRALARHDSRWHLEMIGDGTATAPKSFDAVVVATQARQAARLLDDVIDANEVRALDQLCYEPITTCYLQYASGFTLAHPFLTLLDDPQHQAWGQFVFDRGQLDPDH